MSSDAPLHVDLKMSGQYVPVEVLTYFVEALETRATDVRYVPSPEVSTALLAAARTLRNHIDVYAVNR